MSDYTGGFQDLLIGMANENQRKKEKALGFIIDEENAKRSDKYNQSMLDLRNNDAKESARHNSSMEVMRAEELANAQKSQYQVVYINGVPTKVNMSNGDPIKIVNSGSGGGAPQGKVYNTLDGKPYYSEESYGEALAAKRKVAMDIKKQIDAPTPQTKVQTKNVSFPIQTPQKKELSRQERIEQDRKQKLQDKKREQEDDKKSWTQKYLGFSY